MTKKKLLLNMQNLSNTVLTSSPAPMLQMIPSNAIPKLPNAPYSHLRHGSVQPPKDARHLNPCKRSSRYHACRPTPPILLQSYSCWTGLLGLCRSDAVDSLVRDNLSLSSPLLDCPMATSMETSFPSILSSIESAKSAPSSIESCDK